MNGFYEFFCKVEFLCYQGEPNWLGWIVIIPVGYVIFILLVFVLINSLVVGK